MLTVVDRGYSCQENLAYPQGAGERMRDGSPTPTATSRTHGIPSRVLGVAGGQAPVGRAALSAVLRDAWLIELRRQRWPLITLGCEDPSNMLYCSARRWGSPSTAYPG